MIGQLPKYRALIGLLDSTASKILIFLKPIYFVIVCNIELHGMQCMSYL